jgi:pimeloyl-ACP methyl ester carboxylesterase
VTVLSNPVNARRGHAQQYHAYPGCARDPAPARISLHPATRSSRTPSTSAFLGRPGQQDIQTDRFYDYRTNVASYPAWQDWLRKRQPPLQVVWGRYDPSFQVEEAEAYRRDVPAAEVHVLDAGYFALDEQPDLIADLTRRFLQRLDQV